MEKIDTFGVGRCKWVLGRAGMPGSWWRALEQGERKLPHPPGAGRMEEEEPMKAAAATLEGPML